MPVCQWCHQPCATCPTPAGTAATATPGAESPPVGHRIHSTRRKASKPLPSLPDRPETGVPSAAEPALS
jgi:hypothetical protein